MPDDLAISAMNYEQYFQHLMITLTGDREDQKYIGAYFEEYNAHNRMLNFRDTRDIIFASILQMEEVTYQEQNKIVESLKESARILKVKQEEETAQNMADNLGKPFYVSLKDEKDIFC